MHENMYICFNIPTGIKASQVYAQISTKIYEKEYIYFYLTSVYIYRYIFTL